MSSFPVVCPGFYCDSMKRDYYIAKYTDMLKSGLKNISVILEEIGNAKIRGYLMRAGVTCDSSRLIYFEEDSVREEVLFEVVCVYLSELSIDDGFDYSSDYNFNKNLTYELIDSYMCARIFEICMPILSLFSIEKDDDEYCGSGYMYVYDNYIISAKFSMYLSELDLSKMDINFVECHFFSIDYVMREVYNDRLKYANYRTQALELIFTSAKMSASGRYRFLDRYPCFVEHLREDMKRELIESVNREHLCSLIVLLNDHICEDYVCLAIDRDPTHAIGLLFNSGVKLTRRLVLYVAMKCEDVVRFLRYKDLMCDICCDYEAVDGILSYCDNEYSLVDMIRELPLCESVYVRVLPRVINLYELMKLVGEKESEGALYELIRRVGFLDGIYTDIEDVESLLSSFEDVVSMRIYVFVYNHYRLRRDLLKSLVDFSSVNPIFRRFLSSIIGGA